MAELIFHTLPKNLALVWIFMLKQNRAHFVLRKAYIAVLAGRYYASKDKKSPRRTLNWGYETSLKMGQLQPIDEMPDIR